MYYRLVQQYCNKWKIFEQTVNEDVFAGLSLTNTIVNNIYSFYLKASHPVENVFCRVKCSNFEKKTVPYNIFTFKSTFMIYLKMDYSV